jgi:DNA-binding CsgD family transcriptional regulator
MSNNGENDKSRFTTRNKLDEYFRLYFHQSEKGLWMAELDEPLPINLPIDQQVEHLLKHAYLSDCNLAFVKMYGYEDPKEMIGVRFPQLFDNGEPSNLENLRKFFESNCKISQIETFEIGRNGIRVCCLNDVTGIVEDGYLVRVWGEQVNITEVKARNESEKQLLKQMTPEQLQILKMMVEGKTMKEIAADSGLSFKAVEFQLNRIKEIFKADTIKQVIVIAVKLGIEDQSI